MSSSESPPQREITAPYGSWKSPITADVVSGASKRLGGTAVDSRGRLVWLESRPNESGREIHLPSQSPLIMVSPAVTYADGVFDSRFNRFVTVREGSFLHLPLMLKWSPGQIKPYYHHVEVNLSGGDTLEEPKVLVSGNDFYAFPRLDPKCERLAWIQWTLPNMPWDKAQLWVGYISESGTIDKRVCVAGCDPEYVESPTEPKWSPRGELFFVTDRKNGFWNIHKWIESTNEVVSVYPLDGEFTKPLWVFGTNSYEIIECSEEKNLIACSYRQKGKSYLGILDDSKGSCSLLDIPLTDFDNITLGNQCLYVEGASAVLPPSVAKVTLDKHKMKALSSEIVWSSSTDVLNIEEKPPLIVKSHGMQIYPFAYAFNLFSSNLIILILQSVLDKRGWAFVDVNYGGSTGYGREYRERVLRRWGIVDVDDCCGCAKYLVSSGKADVKRLFISGGSAGGYTALTALALRDVFKAGASLYGVADLKMLKEGHKFESRYIDSLVEEEKDFYERSPINFVDSSLAPSSFSKDWKTRFLYFPLFASCIFFITLCMKKIEFIIIVNPDQTRKIYQALKEKGVPVALVEYEGEEHGFRKAENIKYTLEQLMVFFARVVGGFQVADDITPLKIDNFDTSSDA
ncbi:alpha/beta-Hydrolases superfamily protein [Raphanus sativus]|nr:alpha/beta-Hydrolases superfamily protein [Raphanus sativus]